MKFNKRYLTGAFVLALLLMVNSAWAGPTWTFGPEDQGLMRLDYKGQFQLNLRDIGAEADGKGDTAEFNFRRNRLSLIGAYGSNLGIYVQTEFREDNNLGPVGVGDGDNSNFQILDAQVRFKVSDAVRVRLGKFKYNLTRENLEACEAPLSLDRSLFIRAPLVNGTRDYGVAAWGNLLEDKFQYRVDVMNGRNDAASAPTTNLRYTARAHVSLWDAEKSYGYKGTYAGEKKVFTVGAAYSFEKDAAYANVAGLSDAVDYSAWTADLFIEYPIDELGDFTLSAAYVDYDLDDAYQGADPDSGVSGLLGQKNGGYVKVGYMLPTQPLQFFARSENWSFAELDNVFSQELDWYGIGFNYYFKGQKLKLTAEYSMADFDQEGTFDGVETEDFSTFTTQMQLIF